MRFLFYLNQSNISWIYLILYWFKTQMHHMGKSEYMKGPSKKYFPFGHCLLAKYICHEIFDKIVFNSISLQLQIIFRLSFLLKNMNIKSRPFMAAFLSKRPLVVIGAAKLKIFIYIGDEFKQSIRLPLAIYPILIHICIPKFIHHINLKL